MTKLTVKKIKKSKKGKESKICPICKMQEKERKLANLVGRQCSIMVRLLEIEAKVYRERIEKIKEQYPGLRTT